MGNRQPKVTKEELALLHESLQQEAELSQTYLVLIISSCLIATFGLISNSSAVIIGAMIIAPLMLPQRGLAFAALEGSVQLFRNSLISIRPLAKVKLTPRTTSRYANNPPDAGRRNLAPSPPLSFSPKRGDGRGRSLLIHGRAGEGFLGFMKRSIAVGTGASISDGRIDRAFNWDSRIWF